MSPVSILGETVLRVALFSLFGRSVPDVSYTFGALDQRGVGSWALYKASRRLGSEHLGPTHPSTCWRPQDPLLVKNNLVFGGLRTLTLSQNPGGPSGQSPIIGSRGPSSIQGKAELKHYYVLVPSLAVVHPH